MAPPPMANFKSALVTVAGRAATYSIRALEILAGHESHSPAHEAEAALAAATSLSTSATLDGYLATFLAALDARYAGAPPPHAPPIVDDSNVLGMVGLTAELAVEPAIEFFELAHGRVRGAPPFSHPWGLTAFAAAQAAAKADVDLWLAALDARYQAGTCATAPGTTMAGALLALQLAGAMGCVAVKVMEEQHGHYDPAHWVPHINAAIAQEDAKLALYAPTILAALLAQWDARYAAHP